MSYYKKLAEFQAQRIAQLEEENEDLLEAIRLISVYLETDDLTSASKVIDGTIGNDGERK
jgi:hypothetical protein